MIKHHHILFLVRIEPKNINQLGSQINKKTTYLNKTFEQTCRKGELRSSNPNISTYKLPNYRENLTEDFVYNSGMNKIENKLKFVENILLFI